MRDKKLFREVMGELESRDVCWGYRRGRTSTCSKDSDSYTCIFPLKNGAYRASVKRVTYFIDGIDDEIYTLSVFSGRDEVASWSGEMPKTLYESIGSGPKPRKLSKTAKSRKVRGY